jgi:hypothetical protein
MLWPGDVFTYMPLPTISQIFFNFLEICVYCVSVAVFRHILQNILQYITKDRDTYTYITEIEKIFGRVYVC